MSSPIISVRDCHSGQRDVIIANSIQSIRDSIVISFRRIDFSSRQTPNFAYNWVPPFQRLTHTRIPFIPWLYFIYLYTGQIISIQMMPPLRSFDDVDGKERGQTKSDDLWAMTTLGPRTLQYIQMYSGTGFESKLKLILKSFPVTMWIIQKLYENGTDN